MSEVQAPSFADLKNKQRANRDDFPEELGLRIHRTISWVGRAEKSSDDNDARFIFLWIAFNAAYAGGSQYRYTSPGERMMFSEYFARLVSVDADKRIYNAIWQRFSGPVRLIMENKFTFHPFWQYQNGVEGYEDWADRFRLSAQAFSSAFQSGDTVKVLCMVFDRLYVLRNQLVHGGATWNSAINREQLRDGAAMLGFLLPVFADLMMDYSKEDWGTPLFPVISATS